MTVKEYYVFQDEYWTLKQLNQLLRTPNTESNTLIDYVSEHKIDPNCYLELNEHTFVPLIYQVSLTPKHTEFFKWLVSQGANPKKLPDSDPGYPVEHILFAAHPKYLKFLTNTLNITVPRDQTSLDLLIQKKLKFGNLKRLKLLIKQRVLSANDLQRAISPNRGDLAFDAVEIMLDRINLICRTHNDKDEIDEILEKYTKIFELLRPSPLAQKNQITLIQYCTNFYLHPIIGSILKPLTADQRTKAVVGVEIKYHRELDERLVALLRQLYNDRRYVETCDLIGVSPVAEAF